MLKRVLISYVLAICFGNIASVLPDRLSVRDRQAKILELVRRLGTEDDFEHVQKPFPFNDPTLFNNEEALKNFTIHYNQGYLDKNGLYLPLDYKTYQETRSLFDLFYFAKDFNTFYKIAVWAKKEINPVQFLYALTSAVLHRSELSSISMPPIYEILPDYFVPSSVMNAAYRARLNEVDYRKFLVNNTGWERGPKIKYTPYQRDVGKFDQETRLSYYREDVTRSDFFFKYFKKIDMSMKSKYGQVHERMEEWYLTAFRWILTRYNLERYAVDLPPVQPLNLDKNLDGGYDPQVADLHGRYFSKRPDSISTHDINPEELIFIERAIKKLLNGEIDRIFYEDQLVSQVQGSETIPKASKHLANYLLSIYYGSMELIDRISNAFNNKFSQGVLLNDLTRMRDPAYYQVLGLMNELVQYIESRRGPYSQQQLGFPGVEIADIKVSKLETFFEYYDFDITNTIPGKGGVFIASQYRINHRPFSVRINIRSNVKTTGTMKIFLGTETDILNRSLSLNQLRQTFTLMDTFQVELREGDNIIKRTPGQSELTSESPRMADILTLIDSGHNNFQSQCYYPSHLMLPKGSSYGKKFKLFFIIYPSEKFSVPTKGCGRDHLTSDITRSLPFPVDKPWVPSALKQANIKFVDTYIYHTD